jgi:AraC-like DNA-binding protein
MEEQCPCVAISCSFVQSAGRARGAPHILQVMADVWAPVDRVGEVLHFLRMSGAFYSSAEFRAPWGLVLPPLEHCLMFHIMTAGRCWLAVEGVEPRELQAGELALVPHGEGHSLTSDLGAAAARLFDVPRQHVSERYETIRHGGNGPVTTMLCGAVRFEHPAAERLVSQLPKIVVVNPTSSPYTEWLNSTLGLLTVEAKDLRPGGETVITRLADILVIQAIRSWIDRDPGAQTGWLGALRDGQIGRALTLIHRAPAHPWTVAALAGEVAMSRSAFAARFTELVGEPVMHYVARWRMHVAVTWLQDDDTPIGELASRLGYESEAAFSRAFKRTVGAWPGTIRRRSHRVRPGSDSVATPGEPFTRHEQ